MPGFGIPDFNQHAARIAKAGIYDLAVHHEQILVPVVLRQWDVEHVTGLDAEGEQAHDRLMKRLAKSERVARRVAERREPPHPRLRSPPKRQKGQRAYWVTVSVASSSQSGQTPTRMVNTAAAAIASADVNGTRSGSTSSAGSSQTLTMIRR